MTITTILLLLASIVVVTPIVQPAYAVDGLNFRNIENLSDTPGTSSQPAIAAYGRNVYVVWQDETPSGNSEIFFKRSQNGGASFGSTRNLSDTPGTSSQPAIAAYRDNVYVVWQDETQGNSEIFFKRSQNGGASFGSTRNLSDTPEKSQGPDVAAYGRNVYVVWSETTRGEFIGVDGRGDEIFFKRSQNGGASFGSTTFLSNTLAISRSPAIAAYGRNVYVVWEESTSEFGVSPPEILLKRSQNEGGNFGSTRNLSNNLGDSSFPDVAAYGRNVYVVWQDTTEERLESGVSDFEDIFFKRSQNEGGNFGSTRNLSDTRLESSLDPAIAAFGRNVYVVWEEGPEDIDEGEDILFRRSNDRGGSFGSTRTLNDDDRISVDPAIAAYGRNVYVVWTDVQLEDIFFRRDSS